MKLSLQPDLLLNIVLPIAFGGLLYAYPGIFPHSSFVHSYIADGLWAYAFVSCILIIWGRRINLAWLSFSIITMFVFEALQYFQLIPGTGDAWDLVMYIAGGGLAVLANLFFIAINPKHPLFTGTMDNWDPAITNAFAKNCEVILFNNRGVAGSGGKTPESVSEMANDAVDFIKTLGYMQVDLLGFSLGGFIAQHIAANNPPLVRKIVLAGTGPIGSEGITNHICRQKSQCFG